MSRRKKVTPADRDYSWTRDRVALAVLESSGIAPMADSLPKRDPAGPGRPNHYPDHIYVLANMLRGALGAERQAWGWLNEPSNWLKVQSRARRYWGLELLPEPPSRSTVHSNLARLAAFDDQFREKFIVLAVEQAQEQGCLSETSATMNKPLRPNVVSADGTVLMPRLSNKARERAEAEGRFYESIPMHVEGGSNGHPVTGHKELIMTVRPDNHPNSRIILGVVAVPKEGVGGEAGVAVEELRKLREITKGFLGLRYDGAFMGKHIDAMMKCGVSTITPVPKSDRRRLLKNLTCKAGCKHTLYTEGGDFIELERLNTGATHPLPCKRVNQYSRRNADGSYRWYAELKLVCGQNHTERLDTTDEDRRNKFNRTQAVRMHPPESKEYKDTYGWRQDVESVNNNLDTTLYRHRMIVDTLEKQALVMVGFAMARNAISAKVFRERQRQSAANQPPMSGSAAA